ncbi:hypothetical protein CVT26_012357 [Gymnopilus dilepis]|uniref:F-box domain-containing protein n=1 Tax=Gymnopilus dilepis TaxID=231916 RepID=A0A409WDF5_9AGAR|nr:hypothetical protein CVT26_012357 [Gymnopilus dilepis]
MPDLPPELWTTIFRQLVAVDNTALCRPRILLTNRTWYQVATSIYDLWTRIEITTPHIAQVQFYISHSGALPLDIHLTVLGSMVQDMHPVARLIASHLHRIRLLELHVQQHEDAEHLVQEIGRDQPAPLLEVLSISLRALSPWVFSDSLVYRTTFSSAPRLAHLILPVYPLPRKRSCALIHFPSLTHLTLDARSPFHGQLNPEMVFELLGALVNLESFTFKSTDTCSYFNTSGFPLVESKRLRSVDISAPGWGLDILARIVAPSLQNVCFDTRRDGVLMWSDVLALGISDALRLLSERSPSVTHVELYAVKFSYHHWRYPWLLGEAFPLLQVLKLDDTDITDAVLERTSQTSPHFRRLELRGCPGVTEGGWLSFLSRRDEDFELVVDGRTISR